MDVLWVVLCRSGAYAEAWGQRNAEKDRLNVCLWICVFYLGRGALTLYLYFLQVDTWEEVNLFNYLPLALYKSIFLFFCCFVGLYDVFVILYFLGLYYNYPRRP